MDITSYLLGKKNAGGGGGGGGSLDWESLGLNNPPEAITDIYNQTKDIVDNWDNTETLNAKYQNNYNLLIFPSVELGATQTIMTNTFNNCTNLIQVGNIDTSKVTNIAMCFGNCVKLKYLPILDLSSATWANGMVAYCEKFTDETLDNLLQSCISAINLSTKTLYGIGIYNKNVYPVSRISALPHYQDFVDAGWTIGYD